MAQEKSYEAASRRDFDAFMSYVAPDAVWGSVAMDTSFEGVAAIREFVEDWFGSYDELVIKPEQILDLGSGVTFVLAHQEGCLAGSSGRLDLRQATVIVWVDGVIVSIVNYPDIDQARAAAEGLAEERAGARGANRRRLEGGVS